MTIEEVRAAIAAAVEAQRALHTAAGDANFTAEQEAAFEAEGEKAEELRAQEAELVKAEERSARVAEARKAMGAGVQVSVKPAKNENLDILRNGGYGSTRAQKHSAIMRSMESKIEDGYSQAEFEKIVKRHVSDTAWSMNLLARSTDVYHEAWAKVALGREMFMNDEERAAMAVGTNTAGGYLVPTHLDPTLIITNNGSEDIYGALSRKVTLTNENVWRGVTTAGSTASWDGELVEVSDDTPAFAPVAIPVFSAKSLVQASIEAQEDIANLGSDVLMILQDSKDRLLAAAHATGNGTTAPKGVWTAINAVAGDLVQSASAAAIVAGDLHTLYRTLPRRYRSKAVFSANPLYALAIKALGAAVSYSFSGDLRDGMPERILGRPFADSDEAPTTQTTTALDNEVLFGDFSQYVTVSKPGSTAIEYIPHMFNTANNLPDGRRAWYMHFREGADVVDTNSMRMLVDKTSA